MPQRTGRAQWNGDLRAGSGHLTVGNGVFEGAYSFQSRFENSPGTNPEELIAAAHAACFSMAAAAGLSRAGFVPERVETTATVNLESEAGGFSIKRIDLDMRAKVPGIDETTFQRSAEEAKKTCPVSRALAAVDITLRASLQS